MIGLDLITLLLTAFSTTNFENGLIFIMIMQVVYIFVLAMIFSVMNKRKAVIATVITGLGILAIPFIFIFGLLIMCSGAKFH